MVSLAGVGFGHSRENLCSNPNSGRFCCENELITSWTVHWGANQAAVSRLTSRMVPLSCDIINTELAVNFIENVHNFVNLMRTELELFTLQHKGKNPIKPQWWWQEEYLLYNFNPDLWLSLCVNQGPCTGNTIWSINKENKVWLLSTVCSYLLR